MPLIYQKQINEATKIGVWHITEDEDFFSKEVEVQRQISHPHKRLQHLAGRYTLKHLFPDFPLSLIQIADTRKPFLHDEAFHFSLSHCDDYAAAIVSTVYRVGVDIEVPHTKIEKIVNKFLSEEEKVVVQNINEDIKDNYTLAWSVKEAVFKWYGSGNVDFKADMNILSVNESHGGFDVSVLFNKDINRQLSVRSQTINGNFLSRIVD